MTLDLGALVGRVILETTTFDRAYTRVVQQFSLLGEQAGRASGGTLRLDESLAALGTTAGTAAAGLTRTERAAVAAAAADAKGAAAATRHAEATTAVNAALAESASLSTRDQAAVLRLVAARDRLNAVTEGGVATTRQLAGAQAGLIVAEERAAATGDAAVAGMGRARTAMGGFLRTAAGLGLALGAFELIKKAIDVTKEASAFQRDMLLIQTQAGASAAEVRKMTPAILALAGPVATAPEKLALSLYHAYSVTKNMAQALDIVKIAAEGAKVGHADLEQTTNALTAAVASGIPGVNNYTQAMGALNAIVGAGDMKLSDLNEALHGTLITAKLYGLSISDVGGALATFGDHNMRGAYAATQLRMAVMALAVPARGGATALAALGLTSEGSSAELAKLGLKTGDLAKDLQTGGLNKALLDLKSHLDKAGVSTAETGTVLTQVFGKKAGIGLGVLIGDLPRFEQKLKQVADGAQGFGAAWTATTHTAAFAFQKLGAEAQVAGITLTQKLLPSLTSAATWLGTSVPNAISTVQALLGPLEHEVGGALTLAWHGLAAVLRVVVGAFSGLSGILSGHKTLVTAVGTAVLGMWAAYKGVAIASAALSTLSVGMTALTTRVLIAKDTMGMFARGTAMMSLGTMAAGIAGVGFAFYELGKAVSHATEAQNSLAQVIDHSKNAQQSWAAALQQSNGAIDENVQKSVALTLQQDGIAAKAAAAGISLRQLTNAVTGGATAWAQLTERWKAGGKPSSDTLVALGLLARKFGDTSQKARDMATAFGTATGATGQASAALTAAQKAMFGASSDAYLAAAEAAKKNTDATTAQTLAFQLENNAAGLVNQALATMAGQNLNIAQAKTSDAQATMTLTDALAKNGGTVADNTTKGLANQQALEGKASSLRAVLSAEAAGTTGTVKATAEYHRNADAILAQIGKQYGLTSAVYVYAKGILAIPKTAPTKVDLEKAAAEANRKAWLRGLSDIPPAKYTRLELDHHVAMQNARDFATLWNSFQDKTITLSWVTQTNAGMAATRAGGPGRAGGGTIYGPGTSKSDSILTPTSVGEEVIQEPYASRNRALLKLINRGGDPRLMMPAVTKAMDNRPALPGPAASTPPPVVYVQNPFTGEYLLAQVASVADQRAAGQAREFRLTGR